MVLDLSEALQVSPKVDHPSEVNRLIINVCLETTRSSGGTKAWWGKTYDRSAACYLTNVFMRFNLGALFAISTRGFLGFGNGMD